MTTAPPDTSWSIAIKTVGGLEENFTVTVSPDQSLTCLHHKIENVTGLKASQQRLIYRGRLISCPENEEKLSKKNEPKVRDVVGLCDGQTIHLVPKPDCDVEESPREDNNNNNQSPSEANDTSSSGGGASSLLAALFGLGSSAQEEEDLDDSGIRPSRRRSSQRRRPNYRLAEADIVVPDPGTMEPVRQGLMTLHTMLNAAPTNTEQPWQANRTWYRGQWVDCRDTVNQWLEATIVDIARPEDILPERIRPRSHRRPTEPVVDPAVSANDFEGRRQLLLELDEEEGLFCERQNNDTAQLLLIHYNGWPHRWDEWIRSDSERIRPFRTRTRHNASRALPTPQSVYDAAPATSIRDDSDEGDRKALLPELSRAVSSVSHLLDEVVSASCDDEEHHFDGPGPNYDLPWLSDADDFPSAWSGARSEHVNSSQQRYSRRQLMALAPILDRLGRCISDAAPHIASLASTLPKEEVPSTESRRDPEEDNVIIVGESNEEPPPALDRRLHPISLPTGGGLFSLLSRESRTRTNAASRDSETSLVTAEAIASHGVQEESDSESFEADYVDFVNSMVNTTRGDSRSGGRSGSLDDAAGLLGAYLALSSLVSEGSNDENTEDGGLGGLGRLLREQGNGGGGIDIHIHAIVTGPGVGPGGIAVMGGPPLQANAAGGVPRGLFSGVGRRGNGGNGMLTPSTLPSSQNEDDMGIFEDLYSENPAPLDPHGYAASVTGFEAGNNRDERSEQDESSSSNSRPSSILETPPRLSSHRNGPNPRRGSTLGRSLRRMLSPRSRSNPSGETDSDRNR